MKTRFGYMALGAVLGIGGMLIGMSLPSVTAQNNRFGAITCTGLKVVAPDGTETVKLDSLFIKGYGYGGRITASGTGRKSPGSTGPALTASAGMGVSGHGSYAVFWDSEGAPALLLGGGGEGGSVHLYRQGFKGDGGSVNIAIDENGGQLGVIGSNGKSGAVLRVHDNQGGDLSVYDRHGTLSAGMSAQTTGGMVSVSDSDNDSRAGAALFGGPNQNLMILDKYGDIVASFPQRR